MTLSHHGATTNYRLAGNDLTALDLVAFLRKVDTLEALLEHGADARASGGNGYTALHHAATGNGVGAIVFLVGSSANVEDNRVIHGGTALHEASCHGSVEAILALLRYETIVDSAYRNGETPLVLATVNNKLSPVEALLAVGGDVSHRNAADDMVPLDLAISLGTNTEIDVGASDGHGKSPIHIASSGRSTTNKSDETALKVTVKTGILKVFVRHGVDVNAINPKAHTILHTPVNRGQTRLIDFLKWLHTSACRNAAWLVGDSDYPIEARRSQGMFLERYIIIASISSEGREALSFRSPRVGGCGRQ